jgi:hypothetical protein
MDTQIVEILGRSLLMEQLLRGGIEVATPVRDRGVDLIAYIDLDAQLGHFIACPIQMKAAVAASFSIDNKYTKFMNLIQAYVWNVESQRDATIYALTQSEAVEVARDVGYTNTPSWKEHGRYVSTKPSARLIELLQPHRMTSERWKEKIATALTVSARSGL